MIVTGWNNGSPDDRIGAGYGIRITRDQDRYFKKSWASIVMGFEMESQWILGHLIRFGNDVQN